VLDRNTDLINRNTTSIDQNSQMLGLNTQTLEHHTIVLESNTAILSKIQDNMGQNGMQIREQTEIFQKSYDMLKMLEGMIVSPPLGRAGTGLSGTTEASTEASLDETMEVDGVSDPIAPGLIHHPGFNFRDDRLERVEISRRILDWIERWMDPNNLGASRVYVRTSARDDRAHDLCNRIVYEMANSQLLCYNGLPREGPPPAEGWYTMPHLVWWLSAQLRMPMPHIDGHMPASGYSPDVASLAEKLEKTQENDPVYVVLYLPTKSCHCDSDFKLYNSLVAGLCGIPSGQVRVLLFSDGTDDAIMGSFGSNTIVIDNLTQQQNRVLLADWSPESTG
jgi:hypothetical protein